MTRYENAADRLEHMKELHKSAMQEMQALIDAAKRYGYSTYEIGTIEEARAAFGDYANDGVLCEARLALAECV